MLKHPRADIGINFVFVFVSWYSSSYFGVPQCSLFCCLYSGYLIFRVHNYLHNFVLSDMLKPFPVLNLNSSSFTILVTVLLSEAQSVHLFLTTDLTSSQIGHIYGESKINMYLCVFFSIMVAQFLHTNLTFSTHMFAEQIASYQVALARHYPRGHATNLHWRSYASEAWLAKTIFSCLALLMIGVGFALSFELIFGGAFVLMECQLEWFSIGPSWFKRKMVIMDYILYFFFHDEEEATEDNASQEPGKKTRMTLKEFMMSDSQRA